MNGIDIASYQSGINLTKVPCDFVIIKATQGTSYINPDMTRAYKQALSAGKKIGLYHYASKGGSGAEAKHFTDTVIKLGAVGKAILVLDWEAGDNVNWGNVAYAKAFLDYVKSRTGVTPFIYMSKSSGCRSFDFSSIAKTNPLWVAQYANYKETAYKMTPWTDTKGYGAWSKPLIFQYTSSGILNNWRGHLDLNIAYMTPDEWDDWADTGSHGVYPKTKPDAAPVVDTTDYPVTRYGHRNAWVRLLQNALNVRGFVCESDGVFGSQTIEQVRLFQRSRGLTADGVVGALTWKALFS